jgi:hypothetical protein
MLPEVPVQSDSVADVGMIEMANWVDVDPLNVMVLTTFLGRCRRLCEWHATLGFQEDHRQIRAIWRVASALPEGMAVRAVE